jgi:hypothetical protein
MENITRDQLHYHLCKTSFHYFVKFCWSLSKAGTEFIDEPYVKFICDHLQQRMEDMCNGIPRKGLLLSIAPASGKSFIMSVCAPIYLWILKPESTAMMGSVNDSLATQFATDSRSIIQHPEFQKYFPFELREDVNAKQEFKNLQGGYRISFGFQTPVIGKHSPYLQCWDDCQSVNLLASEPDRKRINDTVAIYLPTRKGSSKFAQRWMVMQRLGVNDAFAHLESFGIDEVICLPAELNDKCTNPELYNEDGLLAPRLLPREELEKIRASLGSIAYGAQYQQDPQASENLLIRPEWFQIVDKMPETGSRLHVFLDTAVVATKSSDYNSAAACLVNSPNLYVIGIFNEKCGFMDLIQKFPEWVKSLPYYDNRTQIWIETKGSGHQVLDYLKQETNFNAHKLEPPENDKSHYTQSKEKRFQGMAPKIENGKVRLLRASWNAQLIDQCTGMNSRNDDLADALEFAITKLISNTANTGFSTRMRTVDIRRGAGDGLDRMRNIYYG